MNRCENCIEYDHLRSACTLEWNNLDPDYYIPGRDYRDENDSCDSYEWDGINDKEG